jgi:hypothetical protein
MPYEGESDKTYNRIVIIGNGYDLALGLPTSYKDFLLYYLKSSVLKAFDAPYKDPFIEIKKIKYANNSEIKKVVESIESFDKLREFCSDRNRIPISLFHSLYSEILKSLELQNWIDIETLYFNLLTDIVAREKKTDSKLNRDYSAVTLLNEELKYLTERLKEYILSIDTGDLTNPYKSPLYSLNDSIKEKQYRQFAFITHGLSDQEIEDPAKILALNFNYTNFFNRIALNMFNSANNMCLNIHGNIQTPNNPIIFGYGDDTHDYYKELEVEDVDHLLENIKSFHYPRTDRYHTLLNFMAENKYEVFIIGHSCGLSDRTLLKTIFEDPHCLCVKIFHRKDPEEHFYKSIAVSRHFDNKEEMRKKILPYDEFAVIPQNNS